MQVNFLSQVVGLTHKVPVKLNVLVYIELAISFLIGRKRTVNFRNERL